VASSKCRETMLSSAIRIFTEFPLGFPCPYIR
jgi:hypothetical protein